jgi:Mn-dependent DtxR family transcriptional regulator
VTLNLKSISKGYPMGDLNSQEKSYLEELYRMTSGDATVQASMHDVGAAIGLDKEAAGKLAEELIAQGYVEIRTLSGGIGITELGIESAQTSAGGANSLGWRLGETTILDEKGCEAVEAALEAIKSAVGKNHAQYPQMETLVIDIKTIEIQMLSPQPKTSVIREVLRSLQQTLSAIDMTNEASVIQQMLAT